MPRGRKKKLHGKTVDRGLRLPQELAARLDRAVQLTGKPGSDLMRDLLDQGLTQLLRKGEQEHVQELRAKIDKVLAGPPSVGAAFGQFKDAEAVPIEVLLTLDTSWIPALTTALQSHRVLKAQGMEHALAPSTQDLKRIGQAGTRALLQHPVHVKEMVREVLRISSTAVTEQQVKDLLEQAAMYLTFRVQDQLSNILQKMVEEGFVLETAPGRYQRRSRSVEEAFQILRDQHPACKPDLDKLMLMVHAHQLEAFVEENDTLVLSRGKRRSTLSWPVTFRNLHQQGVIRRRDRGEWVVQLPDVSEKKDETDGG
jgi:hypothetical protein